MINSSWTLCFICTGGMKRKRREKCYKCKRTREFSSHDVELVYQDENPHARTRICFSCMECCCGNRACSVNPTLRDQRYVVLCVLCSNPMCTTCETILGRCRLCLSEEATVLYKNYIKENLKFQLLTDLCNLIVYYLM